MALALGLEIDDVLDERTCDDVCLAGDEDGRLVCLGFVLPSLDESDVESLLEVSSSESLSELSELEV